MVTATTICLMGVVAGLEGSAGRQDDGKEKTGAAGYERRSPSRPATRPQPAGTTAAHVRAALRTPGRPTAPVLFLSTLPVDWAVQDSNL